MATPRGRRARQKLKTQPLTHGRAKALVAGVLGVGLVAALAMAVAVPAVNTTATTTVAVASIAWYNFSDGMALAEAQDKPVMVDFYADWCFWCKQLDANVYSDPRVVSAARDFVAVKEDVEGDSPLIDLYSIHYIPVVLWLNANGTRLERLDGYVDASEFLEYMGRALQNFRAQGAP